MGRNQLEILAALAGADRELASTVIAHMLGGLGRSSIFAALAALQRDGLIAARWDTEGPHPRRVFRITALGERALDVERRRREARGLQVAPGGAA